MRIFTLLFVCLAWGFSTFSQPNEKSVQTKEKTKIYVKHVNLRTGETNVSTIELSNLSDSISALSQGFDGKTEELILQNDQLKSLEPTGEISENPGYPESTIYYAYNRQNNNLISCTLIDPKFVITSAHKYLSAEETPEEIVFRSLDYLNENDDYHLALGTDIYFFTKDTQDYFNNLALIEVDRPLGAIKGYMAYGYHTEDNLYIDNTLNISEMDQNEGNFVLNKFTATPDIFNEEYFLFKPFYDINSGAPYYKESGIIHGILSFIATSGDGTKYNGALRLNQNKYATIQSVLEAAKPDQFDIVPLKVSVSSKNATTLEPVEGLKFWVHNYSKAGFNGQFSADIYLSSDNIIDTFDIKIGSYSLNANMTSLKTYSVSPDQNPVVPLALSSGPYFIGAIIDTEDANINNNATRGLDCGQIMIENPYASGYVSGMIISPGGMPVEGYCMLMREEKISGDNIRYLTQVKEDNSYYFRDVLFGDYRVVYIPMNNNNHQNIPTYFTKTPYWESASVLDISIGDTLSGVNIERIELSAMTGSKTISGYLTKSEEKSASADEENFFEDVSVIIENCTDSSVAAYTTPDSIGYYEINSMVEGNYNILIDKPGYLLSSKHTVTISGDTEIIPELNFTIGADSTIAATNVVFADYLINQQERYTIYPNPAQEEILVKVLNRENPIKKIKILNIQGVSVSSHIVSDFNSSSIPINIRHLKPGVYIVKLTTEAEEISELFIKK